MPRPRLPARGRHDVQGSLRGAAPPGNPPLINRARPPSRQDPLESLTIIALAFITRSMQLHVHITSSVHLQRSRPVNSLQGIQHLPTPIRRKVERNECSLPLRSANGNEDLQHTAGHNLSRSNDLVRERNHHGHATLGPTTGPHAGNRVSNLSSTEQATPLSCGSYSPVRFLQ